MLATGVALLLGLGLVWGLAGGATPLLAAIQQQLGLWQAQVQAAPLRAAALYLAVVTVCTALLLPTATLQALVAGALFGRGWGTLLAAVGGSLGALLALGWLRLELAAWLRGALAYRLGPRLQVLDDGIAREGGSWLFALRLVPLLPFPVVNAAMALTRMPAGRFWAITQLGMLPASFVYVNAGTELARLRSPADALQPPMLVAVAAVGVLPWLSRRLWRAWLARRQPHHPT